MTSKNYLNLLKWGVWLSPLVLLMVFPPLLFPYITSKQLIFNILIEALLPFWLLLVINYPVYRPRKSWITYGLLAYFFVLLLSCFSGVDFNLSFFGNAERMLGWFHLFHFFLFYLIIITVWREKADWLRFFDIALGVTVIIVLYGIKQNYPASFLGNAAYTAALMLFSLGWSIYQIRQRFIQYGGFKSFSQHYTWLYFVAAFFSLYGLFQANISGAYVGLAAGIIGALFLWSWLSPRKRDRYLGIIVITFLVIMVGFLFLNRQASWLRDSRVGVVLKDFSAANPTWNTRLISWRAAYLDFKDHPILGVGYGNYAFTFDYYFDAHFIDYSPNETYFDRAHNNLVDIVSTAGALGLLTYLSIFVAVAYYLKRAYHLRKIGAGELAIIFGIIVAYFVQNLALFDALVSYIMFFVLLGFIYFFNQDGAGKLETEPRLNKRQEYIGGGVLVLLSLVIIWSMNFGSWRMFAAAIQGYTAISQGQVASGLSYYKESLDLSPWNRDSRSSLINLITGNPKLLSSLDQKTAEELLDYAVELGEKNVSYNPYDSMMNSQLAKVANLAARYNYRSLDKLNRYSVIAVEAIEQAIASSPQRYPLYFIRSDVYLTRGDKTEALASLYKIKEIKPDNQEVSCQLANVNFFFEDYVQSYEYAAQCALTGKVKYLSYSDLIKQAADYQLKQGNQEAADSLKRALER